MQCFIVRMWCVLYPGHASLETFQVRLLVDDHSCFVYQVLITCHIAGTLIFLSHPKQPHPRSRRYLSAPTNPPAQIRDNPWALATCVNYLLASATLRASAAHPHFDTPPQSGRPCSPTQQCSLGRGRRPLAPIPSLSPIPLHPLRHRVRARAPGHRVR